MAKKSSVAALKKKAQACLAKKVDLPVSPLWNMGKVAKFDSEGDLKYLQEALDYLTCKARAKLDFNEDDKEFLKEVYEAFSWGGWYKGYDEAGKLAEHYVSGDGKLLKINSQVYEDSTIVQATMSAMKVFIKELKKDKKNYTTLKCDNAIFMSKSYAKPLKNEF
ncbi:MAG: hypothetical protein JKY66_06945 [Spongiibacteraceae bacterium]|nr:hypothetical protein [Spongiibacteraceae bacterium]